MVYKKNYSTRSKSNLKECILLFISLVIVTDFIGFSAWIVSGQIPADSFYIGRITAEVLKVIL